MRIIVVSLIVSLLTLGSVVVSQAADLRGKVRVQVEEQTLDAGMEAGAYVCAAGHLHLRATVTNLADIALRDITVAGKVFGADGSLLGTATASTKAAILRPGENREVDLEFRTVTGPAVHQVTRRELTVVTAHPE